MNLGYQEIVVIFIVSLLLFGPKKLPDIARAIARGVREFRNVLREIEEGIEKDRENSKKV